MGARSNGCISCKARRVKCDEVKPTCQRCHKAGIACKGYQTLTFINEKPRIERANAVARSQQERHCALRRHHQQLYHSSNARASSLSPTLPLTAFKKNIFISFLVAKMYEGRTQYEEDDTRQLAVLNGTQGWWVGEMIKNEPSKALEALAAMFFGSAHRQDDAKIEALKIYSAALPKLRADLMDNVAMWSFDTLASMTTLCMYELVAYRSGFEWNLHAGGLCRLIELRGPWRHKHYPEKSVFLEHRMILLSRAVVSRRKSFLCQRIWKEVPWEDDPKSKQPVDYLMDVLCDVSALIEDTDKFAKGDKKIDHFELVTRVANAFNELNDWWHNWIRRNGHACKEVPSATYSTLLSDEEGFLFPTLLVYDTFWIAYTLCIHNATRIQLLGLWDILSRTNSSASSHTSPQLDEPNTSPLLGITSDAESLAREILRSIEYCHHQSRHHLGTFCLLFPLDFAYGALGMYSREARWLWTNDEIEVNKLSGFDQGRSIMRLLPAYHFDAPLHRGVKSPNGQRFRDKMMATTCDTGAQAA